MKLLKTLVSIGVVFFGVSSAFAKDISADEFINTANKPRVVLDVRTAQEYKDGHIANAVNMPIAQISDMYSALEKKDEEIVVYCRSGFRAARAITFLEEQGFTNVVHLQGDFGQWEKEERPIVVPK